MTYVSEYYHTFAKMKTENKKEAASVTFETASFSYVLAKASGIFCYFKRAKARSY